MYMQYDQETKEGTNISYLQSSVTNIVSVYQLEYIKVLRGCVLL